MASQVNWECPWTAAVGPVTPRALDRLQDAEIALAKAVVL